ncbi:hypothetical protein H8S90_18875 [Olivibacter sp. SDN3]|nr:hypothetical protein H8S90_18875 [Olivibacter sp. SDN3]
MDTDSVKDLLVGMVVKIAFELREQRKLASCITVQIRYANFETVSRQMKIPYTSLDGLLITKAKELFDKLYDRRMLIRLVGVKLSGLVGGFEQTDLYGVSANTP